MRLATWNVNSIRAREVRLVDYLRTRAPDVLCLQETKCHDELFPVEAIRAAGYQVAFHGQRTFNGVAILSREEPGDVLKGLQDGVEDPQCRVLAATVGPVRVISVYAPNGQAAGSEAYHYKLAWYRRLRRYLDLRTRPGDPVAVCGDFNVAPEDRDVYDPAAFAGQTMCTPAEREAFGSLLGFGLTDAFRLHHTEPGRYTWWDYRMLGFPKNQGLRIDHILLSESLRARCTGSDIDREMRKGTKPSDHAPIWAEFDLTAGVSP